MKTPIKQVEDSLVSFFVQQEPEKVAANEVATKAVWESYEFAKMNKHEDSVRAALKALVADPACTLARQYILIALEKQNAAGPKYLTELNNLKGRRDATLGPLKEKRREIAQLEETLAKYKDEKQKHVKREKEIQEEAVKIAEERARLTELQEKLAVREKALTQDGSTLTDEQKALNTNNDEVVAKFQKAKPALDQVEKEYEETTRNLDGELLPLANRLIESKPKNPAPAPAQADAKFDKILEKLDQLEKRIKEIEKK